jgi:aminoglycoside 3-N-acetyltransferase I
VKVDFQRMGIGRKLVDAVRSTCRELGYEEVFVQADEPDDYALDFYRLTGPTAEERVRHFYYTL